MNTTNVKIIDSVAEQVQQKFENESSGHDWWHLYRVWKIAKKIGEQEDADMPVVELAALLHDIDDWKFNGGDLEAGSRTARKILQSHDVREETISKVCEIIDGVSFKGAGVKDDIPMIEGKIVQDADRLDAIGAIGIARAFTYGGYAQQILHDPSRKPKLHRSKVDYMNKKTTTVNHFYEKLLLLKDRMHTQTATKMAEERHAFIEDFLNRFHSEWVVED